MLDTTPSSSRSSSRRGRAVLVGRALGKGDGHIRVTFGDDFRIEGGSKETHAVLQRQTQAIREELNRRGLSLANITRETYHEVVRAVQELCD